jgi:trehalose transport system permease protein
VRTVAWSPGRLGFYALAALFGLLAVAPLAILFKVSISGPEDVLVQHPPFWVWHPTLEHWADVLKPDVIWPPLRKSLVVATGTAVLSVLIAAPAAYVIARLPRGWRYGVVLALLFTRMFPEVIIATPIAVTFLRAGLIDTDVGLVLAHLIRNLPFVAWILVGTFEVIPRDLEEASWVDGNGRLGTLWSVVLPLALPGIAVAAIFAWLDSWNDLLYAIYLLLADRTLPLMTYYFANRGSVFDVATFSVVLTVPVLVLTLLLQRYIRAGTLGGAVKG